MSAHDRWLAAYYHSVETAYCPDPKCENADGITVDYEQENGIGSMQPDECPICKRDLGWDRPSEGTEGDLSDIEPSDRHQ